MDKKRPTTRRKRLVPSDAEIAEHKKRFLLAALELFAREPPWNTLPDEVDVAEEWEAQWPESVRKWFAVAYEQDSRTAFALGMKLGAELALGSNEIVDAMIHSGAGTGKRGHWEPLKWYLYVTLRVMKNKPAAFVNIFGDDWVERHGLGALGLELIRLAADPTPEQDIPVPTNLITRYLRETALFTGVLTLEINEKKRTVRVNEGAPVAFSTVERYTRAARKEIHAT